MTTVTCPNCNEQFQVVIPDELLEAQSEPESPDDGIPRPPEDLGTIDIEIDSWDFVEEPNEPYSGSDGGPSYIDQEVVATMTINGKKRDVVLWYTPRREDWDYYRYVVRMETDAGQKSLNVYESPQQGLFVKNRAVPWTTDKQWTYLDPAELERRSQIAGLGKVIEDEEGEGGYGLLLDCDERPLVFNSELREDFVETLVKTLLVMKSRENPAS